MAKASANLHSSFTRLKLLLKPYEVHFTSKVNTPTNYDLWSIKEVEVAGRKRKEIYFAGLIIRSSYVGFYFMPLYAEESLSSVFGKELLATLKGKSCFHICELDAKLERQIATALRKGFALYRKRGWA